MRIGRNQKGFTLVELLLVMAVLGIIAAIVVPFLVGHKKHSHKSLPAHPLAKTELANNPATSQPCRLVNGHDIKYRWQSPRSGLYGRTIRVHGNYAVALDYEESGGPYIVALPSQYVGDPASADAIYRLGVGCTGKPTVTILQPVDLQSPLNILRGDNIRVYFPGGHMVSFGD